ncbi:MAG: hydrogenase accessory protein HypB, partial [Firmicutes bacterium]|nr:hydrogenase accessory protein HypB [Bacillota bacterium]
MYETCDLLIINKTDVLPYFDFDMAKVTEYARMRNPQITVLPISAKSGEGVAELAAWLLQRV